MKKGLVLLACLVVIIFAAEAWAAPAVKIGAILPLTGPLAREGQTVKNVMSFAVEEINAGGGIKSMGGAKVELVFGDNQSKPDVAVSEVERLVEREKVLILTEAWQSFITLAATRASERLKTPYYVPNSYADNITERQLHYTFQQTSKASVLAGTWVRFLTHINKNLGGKISKVALLYENTDMGQSSADAAKVDLPKAGFKVVADISYPVRATDLTSYIAKLKAAEPDFVLQGGYMENAVLITKTADRLGLNVPFMDNGCMNDPSFNKAVGTLAEGKLGMTSWNKDLPGGQKLYEKIRARLGLDVSGIYVVGYQAIWVIKEAMEKAGAADREALRNALASINLPASKLYLPLEKISFDEKGYNDKAEGWIITQVQNGEWYTVWPLKYATKKPVLK
jgi:branched-chain amino acid transport system substrate-binding protein